MYRYFTFFVVSLWFASCGPKKPGSATYIISVAVEAQSATDKSSVVEQFERDTITAPSVVEAYNKGVQKYAAVLMHVQQFPDSITGVRKLQIFDEKGQEIVSSIPQEQRDSVIMNFIQFARRSAIPYYDRVKDFELKLMTAR